MIQSYINHIALVVDKSSSMSHLAANVVKVFDNEITYLRKRSVELSQETRISVYLFCERVECLVFDMDVMRMGSLSGHYRTQGTTALVDGTMQAIDDMGKLPELYGDHAFLVYAFTDGEENASLRYDRLDLSTRLNKLPDNWTVACMVPDAKGEFEAKKFGFQASNIQIWSTTAVGIEQVGKEFRSAMDNYMDARSKGQRGTKSFFKVDLAGVTAYDVKQNLDELSVNSYRLLDVPADDVIKDFVKRSIKIGYVKGSAYYELTKSETIQANKEICIQSKVDGKVFGGKNARNIIGLPDTKAQVRPGDHGDWRIYVQSNSVNRKLVGGTLLLVRK